MTAAHPFTEPARDVPIKWLNYNLRYASAIALLALGYVILTAIVLPTTPADARALRSSVLLLPLIGGFVSAIVIPGRGDRRVLYGSVAVAAGIPFLIMIAMPAPSKLVTVLLFSLTAGFIIWAWMLVRDRPRLLHFLALGATVATFGIAGVATEAINGTGPLTVGWPLIFEPGIKVATLTQLTQKAENATIWFMQAAATVLTIVTLAWTARLLAPRMRYITPAQRDARAATALARKQAVFELKNPDAAALPPVNTLATLSLVFALLGGLLSMVFGFIALSQIKRTGELGRGFAIAGIAISFAWMIPVAVFFILGFAGAFNR